MLKSLLRHKLEYLRTFDKMIVCKRILKELIIKRALVFKKKHSLYFQNLQKYFSLEKTHHFINDKSENT